MSVSALTMVQYRVGERVYVHPAGVLLDRFKPGGLVRSLDNDVLAWSPLDSVIYCGTVPLVKIELSHSSLTVTPNHEILTTNGLVRAKQLFPSAVVILQGTRAAVPTTFKESARGLKYHPYATHRKITPHGGYNVPRAHLREEAELNGLTYAAFCDICRKSEARATKLKFIRPGQHKGSKPDRNSALDTTQASIVSVEEVPDGLGITINTRRPASTLVANGVIVGDSPAPW